MSVARVAVLTLNKVDIRAKNAANNRGIYFLTRRESIHQEKNNTSKCLCA